MKNTSFVGKIFIIASFVALIGSGVALAATGVPGTPMTGNANISSSTYNTGFTVTVPLNGNATTTDTLELYLNGTSFPSALTRAIDAGDVTADFYNFTVIAPQLGLDGTSTITATFDGGISTSSPLILTLDSVAPFLTEPGGAGTGFLSFAASSTLSNIGSTITMSFVADAPGYSFNSATINGVARSAGNFSDLGGGNYAITYVVGSGNADVAAGAITGSVSLKDSFNNISAIYNTTVANVLAVDANRPTLSAVSIASNNASTSLAKVGDVVTLSFTSNEVLSTTTVTIAGQPAVIASGTSTVWTATYTLTGTEASGTVPFTINFADVAGNTGTQVTAVTNASSVTFDKTAPTLLAISIASNNANPALAKVGDTVTLSFTSDEPLSTSTVTINGNPATIAGGPTSWTATYVMTSGDANGLVTFSISSFSDLAGNPSAGAVTAVTNSSSVTFDKNPPIFNSITLGTNGLKKIGDTVTLTVNADAAGYTVTSATVNGVNVALTDAGAGVYTGTYTVVSGHQNQSSGAVPVNVVLTDAASNATTGDIVNPNSVAIDAVRPAMPTVTIASNNANPIWAKVGDVVTLTLGASETITAPTVTIAGHAVSSTGSGANWTASYTMLVGDASGTIPFTASFADTAGNAGSPVSAITSGSNVTFDKTAPVISALALNPSTSTRKIGDVVTLLITADAAGYTLATTTVNGVAVTGFTDLGGGNYLVLYTIASGNTDRSAGVVPVSALLRDAASNVSLAATTVTANTLAIDANVPTLSAVSIASNNASTTWAKTGDTVTLSFTSNEAINTPTVTIAGSAATIASGTSTVWTATFVMTATSTEGVVPFTINFSDIAGNSGTAVTATTNASAVTFDRTLPTLSGVSIASNNASTTWAKTGDTVTLSFTSSEILSTSTVTILGRTASVSGSGMSWTATLVTNGTEAEGTVPFTINFADRASNSGTQVTAVTNSSFVVFDRTLPTLSAVTLVSNNASSSRAKVGDVVTLSFTASETLGATPVVGIGINSNVSVTNTVGTTYTATYTMASGDATGNVPFTIAFKDRANNNGTNVTAVTSGIGVLFDKTAPLLSAVSIASNNASTTWAKTADTITLSFTANEAIMNPTVTILGRTASVASTSATVWTATLVTNGTDTEGTVAFNIAFFDVTGNAGTAVTAITTGSNVTFDRTIPTLSAVTIASNNASTTWAKTGDTVTVSFTSSEILLTPTVTILGRSATVSGSGTSWTAALVTNGTDTQGTVPFAINFADRASNGGTQVTAVTNTSFVVFDRTLPTLSPVTITSNNASSSLAKVGNVITLSFTASEILGATPTVVIGANSPAAVVTSTTGTSYTATYTMVAGDTTGVVTFSIAFKDRANNNGTTVTAITSGSNVTFDKTIPTLSTVSIASNNASSSRAKLGDTITLSFTASEAIDYIAPTVTIDGIARTVASTSATVWTATAPVTASSTQGQTAFTINFTDRAGNGGTQVTSTTNTSKVIVDLTAPVITVTGTSPLSVAFGTTYTDDGATATDNIDTSVTVISTSTVNTGVYGTYGVTYTATDAAGNSATASRVVNVDPAGSGSVGNLVTSGGGGGGGGGGFVAPTPTVRKGDTNGDGKVDIMDFNTLMVNWGSIVTPNPADFNGDGKVDLLDFNMLMINWSI